MLLLQGNHAKKMFKMEKNYDYTTTSIAKSRKNIE